MESNIDRALPVGFQHDITRRFVEDAICPRCACNKIVYGHTPLENRLLICHGCKNCAFRWSLGKKQSFFSPENK